MRISNHPTGVNGIRPVYQAAGATALILCALWQTSACDIPVCEYALALWPADSYELLVIGDEHQAAVHNLKGEMLQADNQINLVMREITPARASEQAGALPAHALTGQIPWLVLRYPVRQQQRRILWSGPLAEFNFSQWLDSPMRRTLVQHLQQGCSGVWLMLTSGNHSADQAAFALLNQELDRLERVLRLAGSYEQDQPRAPQFVRLSLNRADSAEYPLITMLLKSEADLDERDNEPMVFPVYGRGLVLYALIGAGINPATITEAAEFLVGECACEVKSDNPGLELLLHTTWEEIQAGGFGDFENRAAQAAAQLEDIRGIVQSSSLTELMLPMEATTQTAPASSPGFTAGWLAASLMLIAIPVLWYHTRLKQKGRPPE